MDGLNRKAGRFRQLRYFEAGVGRVATAVVEEIANIMSSENGNQSFVLRTAFLKTFEFVATRAKSARRRCF